METENDISTFESNFGSRDFNNHPSQCALQQDWVWNRLFVCRKCNHASWARRAERWFKLVEAQIRIVSSRSVLFTAVRNIKQRLHAVLNTPFYILHVVEVLQEIEIRNAFMCIFENSKRI